MRAGGGYQNSARQREQVKRHFSVVCRDYDNESVHRNGINSLVVSYPEEGRVENHANLFSASRDKLIKMWDIDYSQQLAVGRDYQLPKGVNLLCDLDSHTDWVNQIKLIETANALVSCSNDTTIKVWRLKSTEEYLLKQTSLR